MQELQRVKKEERPHRDEMNLVEFPIGILADRVPIDPATGLEVRELVLQRTITEDGEPREQKWIVVGHPSYGGLPRGYDLDVFNAIMTLWSRSDFQHRIVSIGSVYSILRLAGKSDQGNNYRRFYRSLDRLYGVMFEAYYALYNPGTKKRIPRLRFKLLSSDTAKSLDETQPPRGLVRISEEFYLLVKEGYLKITDMERYWRLPTVYARRMFQYLDKHRAHALREQKGKYEINCYLLAKKLGTLDQTLQKYTPGKLRDIMAPALDALKIDGYLTDYYWRKEKGDRATVRLHVIYAGTVQTQASALSEREAAAIDEIGRLLDEPTNRSYHAFIVRELGPDRARRLAGEVMAQAERQPRRTHKGKLFSYLARKERERSSRSAA